MPKERTLLDPWLVSSEFGRAVFIFEAGIMPQTKTVNNDEEPFWKGIFTLPFSSEVIFSKKIKVKVDELPSWEPYIVVNDVADEIPLRD